MEADTACGLASSRIHPLTGGGGGPPASGPPASGPPASGSPIGVFVAGSPGLQPATATSTRGKIQNERMRPSCPRPPTSESEIVDCLHVAAEAPHVRHKRGHASAAAVDLEIVDRFTLDIDGLAVATTTVDGEAQERV